MGTEVKVVWHRASRKHLCSRVAWHKATPERALYDGRCATDAAGCVCLIHATMHASQSVMFGSFSHISLWDGRFACLVRAAHTSRMPKAAEVHSFCWMLKRDIMRRLRLNMLCRLQPGGFPLIMIAFRLFTGCQHNGSDYRLSAQRSWRINCLTVIRS